LLVTANVVLSLSILVTPMMEATSSSGTSVLTRATRRNVPQDGLVQNIFQHNFRLNLCVISTPTNDQNEIPVNINNNLARLNRTQSSARTTHEGHTVRSDAKFWEHLERSLPNKSQKAKIRRREVLLCK
jgi:hypothetical protein